MIKYLLVYINWLLLIKIFFVIWEITNTHNFGTILLQAIIVFSPLWLMAIQTVVLFVKDCFNSTIRKFPLNYAELAIITFTVCYVAYVNILEIISKWLDGVLINLFEFGEEITSYSLSKRILIEYIFSIVNDSDSVWYFLLLPLYIVLVILKLQLQTLSQR